MHDEEEVDRALAAGATLIGVNARNLKTLEVDRDTFARLAPRIPDSVVRVAESGVRGPHDVFEYAKQGAHVVLVAETLVKGNDPRAALESLPRGRPAAVVYTRDRVAVAEGEPGQLDTQLVEQLARDVGYTAYVDEAIAAVDEGRAEVAFLLRPTKIEDVFAFAKRGEVLPPKTTYFYPKLLSGLLFHPL